MKPIKGCVSAEVANINIANRSKEWWREQQFRVIVHFDSNFRLLTSSLIGGLRSSAG